MFLFSTSIKTDDLLSVLILFLWVTLGKNITLRKNIYNSIYNTKYLYKNIYIYIRNHSLSFTTDRYIIDILLYYLQNIMLISTSMGILIESILLTNVNVQYDGNFV